MAMTQPLPFSFLSGQIATPQVVCHITHTSEATHAIIRDNLARSPMYSGDIKGVGPRYCPSIEDKVVRFPSASGIRSSLSRKVWTTTTSIRTASPPRCRRTCSLPSCAPSPASSSAKIMRPGYAIEYDYVDPRELTPGLETKRVPRPVSRRPDQRHLRLRGSRRRRACSRASTRRALLRVRAIRSSSPAPTAYHRRA